MRIVVLAKPVPDATGQERLGPDGRLDRTATSAVVNGNDEYALEAALKLVEASPDGGEVTLLAMAPANAPETLRKALAMGATRGVLVTDPALAGSCVVSTVRVLAAALRELEYDLVFAGADTSDGGGGVVGAGVAALVGLPYLSYAAKVEPRRRPAVRVHRITATGYDIARGADAGARRRHPGAGGAALPVAQGDHGRPQQGDRDPLAGRSRARRPAVGGAAASTRLVDSRPPAARAATRIVKAPAAEAAKEVVGFLAERRLV